jgi:hypothetical protein
MGIPGVQKPLAFVARPAQDHIQIPGRIADIQCDREIMESDLGFAPVLDDVDMRGLASIG